MTTYIVEWCGHKYTYKSDEPPTEAWSKIFYQILLNTDATLIIYNENEENPVD